MGKKHGYSKTRLYRIYNGMKQRCNNPNSPSYEYYGAKGIRVCEEWEKDFLTFRAWALSHGYAEDLSIDRIDPKQGYCPENCRWLTISENAARTKYSKTKESYKKAMIGFRKWWYAESDRRKANERINEIDNIIKLLPDLNEEQLRLVKEHIEWIIAQEEAYKRMHKED